jgi:hypothetical protein
MGCSASMGHYRILDATRNHPPICHKMASVSQPKKVEASIRMDSKPITSAQRLLLTAYAAFNARDIDAALTTMHPNVEWPNGMEGGYVHGHDEVRRYWTRQWGLVDPHVEPQRFACDDTGRVVVDVKQVVRNLAGAVLVDTVVYHAYLIEDGLIRTMEIRSAGASA